ncbi:hypothetical protein NSQ43_05190 [Sporosarcina sp. FSL W8-0480]|uniref:hypothetical protein n=1 Tax=Sporosarcina sp. FSL W8-0480 TaxID=2954701 RepID=UPI0030DC7919
MVNNNNNFQVPYRGQEQQASSSFINAVGPDLSIPGIHLDTHDLENYDMKQQDVHPALFDQNQFANGFGPVYAIPTYPSQYNLTQDQGTFQRQQPNNHPALFGQNQFINGFGPVYAIPTFPPNHGPIQNSGTEQMNYSDGQFMGGGQCQQCGHHKAMMPFCWFIPMHFPCVQQ